MSSYNKLHNIEQALNASSFPVSLDEADITGNIPTNITEVDGNAVDSNIGVAGSGTIRSVLATDTPFMNNYCNLYSRFGTNQYTEIVLEGGIRFMDGGMRQLSYGLESGEFFDGLPTASEGAVQVSCTSALATTQTLILNAVLQDGTAVTSNPISLNGQTAVSVEFPAATNDEVFRIISAFVIGNTQSAGDAFPFGEEEPVYVTNDGAALTSGIPDDFADLWFTVDLGYGVSKPGYIYLPADQTLVPLNASFSYANDDTYSVRYALQFKDTDGDFWFTAWTSGAVNGAWFEFPSTLTLDGGNNGRDLRLIAERNDGASFVESIMIQVHCVMMDTPP